eukprot:TRINITY_DN1047_c0_g1_i1.p2 TRINITY_DN1047_c0_g1~~TRINITY_DN1047_c0_g1_i1.p2  ORF type:complete len:132 (-),score=99.21 TRINITY_DN1047_c0_g1_i1:48-392(-)
MDEIAASEESSFVVEDVQTIIKDSVDATLPTTQAYAHGKVGQWTSNIVEQCLKRLSALNKPFKYVVTCLVMQRNGAGLHTASSCYWDNTTDGSCTFRWDGKFIVVITTVFGLAI